MIMPLLPNKSSSNEFVQTHNREMKEEARKKHTHQSGNARIDDNFDDVSDFLQENVVIFQK